MEKTLRRKALSIFRAALKAADPKEAVYRHFRVSGDTLTAGGRKYSILYSDDSPAGPWHNLADAPVSANPALVVISDSLFIGARFYRLVAHSQLNP